MGSYLSIALGFIFAVFAYTLFYSTSLRSVMPFIKEGIWYNAGNIAFILFIICEILGFYFLP